MTSAEAPRPYRVMTICTGNICRSPMAEVVLRDRFEAAGLGDRVVVDSTGISDEERGNIDALAQQYVDNLGLTGYTQTSSKTGTNVYESVTYVVDLLLFNLSQGIKIM